MIFDTFSERSTASPPRRLGLGLFLLSAAAENLA
jgi:hypothetical protein